MNLSCLYFAKPASQPVQYGPSIFYYLEHFEVAPESTLVVDPGSIDKLSGVCFRFDGCWEVGNSNFVVITHEIHKLGTGLNVKLKPLKRMFNSNSSLCYAIWLVSISQS